MLPVEDEIPNTVKMPSNCQVPEGFRFVPDGGVAGAILYFDSEDWVVLPPPEVDEAVLKYSTSLSRPVWANP